MHVEPTRTKRWAIGGGYNACHGCIKFSRANIIDERLLSMGSCSIWEGEKKISGPRTTESVPSLCSSYGTQNSSSIMMLNLPKLIKEAEESDKKTRKGCTRSRNEL